MKYKTSNLSTESGMREMEAEGKDGGGRALRALGISGMPVALQGFGSDWLLRDPAAIWPPW